MFGSTGKALSKFVFVGLAYISSIVFKAFEPLVFSTSVLVFSLSNTETYLSIIIWKKQKLSKLHYYLAWFMAVVAAIFLVGSFAVISSIETQKAINFIKEYNQIIIKGLCIFLIVPFVELIEYIIYEGTKTKNKFFDILDDTGYDTVKGVGEKDAGDI